MSQIYGYRCYNPDDVPVGWFYTTDSERACNYTNQSDLLHWAKSWKTQKGAERDFENQNQKWQSFSKGGYLKIEIMPDFEIPITRSALRRREWDAANPDAIKKSKDEYDRKNPVMSFRPSPELIQWLDESRWDDDGKPETDAALIKRKLEKLMEMENQGY